MTTTQKFPSLGHEKPFAAQVAHKVPCLAVEPFVQLEVVLVVKLFLALVTREAGPDLVLELEVVATPPRHGEGLEAQGALVLAVLVVDERVDLTLL